MNNIMKKYPILQHLDDIVYNKAKTSLSFRPNIKKFDAVGIDLCAGCQKFHSSTCIYIQFSQHHLLKILSFSNLCFWNHLNSGDCRFVDSYLGPCLYSINKGYLSLGQQHAAFNYYGTVVQYEIGYNDTSSYVFRFETLKFVEEGVGTVL